VVADSGYVVLGHLSADENDPIYRLNRACSCEARMHVAQP
jgi:hypothetical protein